MTSGRTMIMMVMDDMAAHVHGSYFYTNSGEKGLMRESPSVSCPLTVNNHAGLHDGFASHEGGHFARVFAG